MLDWEYILNLASVGPGNMELCQSHLSWADGSGPITQKETENISLCAVAPGQHISGQQQLWSLPCFLEQLFLFLLRNNCKTYLEINPE